MLDDAKPALANALRWASRSTDDADVRRFFQRRLMVYFRTLATMFGAMYVLGFVAVAIAAPARLIPVHTHPAKVASLVFVLLTCGLWLRLRRGPLGGPWLAAADLRVALT